MLVALIEKERTRSCHCNSSMICNLVIHFTWSKLEGKKEKEKVTHDTKPKMVSSASICKPCRQAKNIKNKKKINIRMKKQKKNIPSNNIQSNRKGAEWNHWLRSIRSSYPSICDSYTPSGIQTKECVSNLILNIQEKFSYLSLTLRSWFLLKTRNPTTPI